MKRILSCWFPNWPIQRLVVAKPELRCQRVALFRRDSRRGQLVSAASPMAMQQGVAVGMPLSEAKSLLRRGGSATGREPSSSPFFIFEHDLKADVVALEALADQLEGFSPTVGLETVTAVDFKKGRRADSIFLDVTGLAHLFGDEQTLAIQLMLCLEQQGYLPRVAIAGTVGAAWAFSRFFAGAYFRQHQMPLLIADTDNNEVAGEFNKSRGSGLTLDELPVRALRLEEPVTDTLHQLGIRSLAQLRRLSRNDLAMRFGNEIHRRLDQLTGELEEPIVARRKPSEFAAGEMLEYPTHHRETIEVVIARLAKQLCQQMRAQQQGALEWTVRLVCQSGPPIEFKVGLFQPTSTVDHIMPLLEMQLEQALSPVTRKVRKKPRKPRGRRKLPVRPASETKEGPEAEVTVNEASVVFRADPDFYRFTTIEVVEIGVTVSSYVLLAQQQRKLFDEDPGLDRQALSHLVNRLANRLGATNVVYPTLQSGAQPEYSYRLKPLVDSRRRQQRKVAGAKRQSHVLGRPLRLYRPPLLLKTLLSSAGAGQEVGGESGVVNLRKPTACLETLALVDRSADHVLAAKSQQVVAATGPERIETGWWRGRTVCRDYWRVETEAGQHFWVYRDRRTRRWWLHGEF